MAFQNLPVNGFFFFKSVTVKFIISISADLQLRGLAYKAKPELGTKMSHTCSLLFSKMSFYPN